MKAESKLMVLKTKIEINISAYEIQLERLREEKEMYKDMEEVVKGIDKWIWLNEKRIELLNDLKK